MKNSLIVKINVSECCPSVHKRVVTKLKIFDDLWNLQLDWLNQTPLRHRLYNENHVFGQRNSRSQPTVYSGSCQIKSSEDFDDLWNPELDWLTRILLDSLDRGLCYCRRDHLRRSVLYFEWKHYLVFKSFWLSSKSWTWMIESNRQTRFIGRF